MLTPLAVIRKLGLRHFYFITRNSLEIEMYKETECLRNYFITESIKADENEKSRQTMFSLCHPCCNEEFLGRAVNIPLTEVYTPSSLVIMRMTLHLLNNHLLSRDDDEPTYWILNDYLLSSYDDED